MDFDEEFEKKNSQLVDLLVEVVKNQKRNFKGILHLFIVFLICYTILLVSGVVGFFWYESQYQYDYVTEETITQQVDGDGSSINNVEGNQYNDNAVHNEGN